MFSPVVLHFLDHVATSLAGVLILTFLIIAGVRRARRRPSEGER